MLRFPVWDFSFYFQGVGKVNGYLSDEARHCFINDYSIPKVEHLDRWTPENHDATYPRITRTDQTNFTTSSFWLQDASYVRLKNLTLGYTMPKAWMTKLGVANAKVFLSGENLFTITGLDGGIDPEEASERGWSYGNVKKISLGVRLSF